MKTTTHQSPIGQITKDEYENGTAGYTHTITNDLEKQKCSLLDILPGERFINYAGEEYELIKRCFGVSIVRNIETNETSEFGDQFEKVYRSKKNNIS